MPRGPTFDVTMRTAAAALALGGAVSVPAAAQDFYSRKTITISTFTAPGGAYDAYIRLLARHMSRHIPGRPLMIAVNQGALAAF